MRLFTLDNRLKLCADFVREGSRLVDVGTDHAYLPIWLVKNGVVEHALACDINEGPLNSGKADVERYGLCDNITLRLSDGLERVNDTEADDIVIAGMGGELIARILDDCSWAKTTGKHFILQPMTKCEVLIRFLYENGFEIISQRACECDNKHYTVMLTHYTGHSDKATDSFCYVGKLDATDESSRAYLTHTLSHLQKRAIGDKSLLPIIEEIKGELSL